MKKGTLTTKKLESIFKETIGKMDGFTIKWYQMPFLWLLWLFNGYITFSESWVMYWVDFRGTRYLLKSKELKK